MTDPAFSNNSDFLEEENLLTSINRYIYDSIKKKHTDSAITVIDFLELLNEFNLYRTILTRQRRRRRTYLIPNTPQTKRLKSLHKTNAYKGKFFLMGFIFNTVLPEHIDRPYSMRSMVGDSFRVYATKTAKEVIISNGTAEFKYKSIVKSPMGEVLMPVSNSPSELILSDKAGGLGATIWKTYLANEEIRQKQRGMRPIGEITGGGSKRTTNKADSTAAIIFGSGEQSDYFYGGLRNHVVNIKATYGAIDEPTNAMKLLSDFFRFINTDLSTNSDPTYPLKIKSSFMLSNPSIFVRSDQPRYLSDAFIRAIIGLDPSIFTRFLGSQFYGFSTAQSPQLVQMTFERESTALTNAVKLRLNDTVFNKLNDEITMLKTIIDAYFDGSTNLLSDFEAFKTLKDSIVISISEFINNNYSDIEGFPNMVALRDFFKNYVVTAIKAGMFKHAIKGYAISKGGKIAYRKLDKDEYILFQEKLTRFASMTRTEIASIRAAIDEVFAPAVQSKRRGLDHINAAESSQITINTLSGLYGP